VETIAPLVGVLIGGLLTIAGQLLTSVIQTRTSNRKELATVRAVARLQQHSYWSFQAAALRTLRTGTWPLIEIDERYMASRDDMRLLSAALDAESWRLYSTAIRLQIDVMQAAREFASTPLSEEQTQQILAAFACAEEARFVIAKVSGVPPLAHPTGDLAFTADEICRAMSHPLLAPKTDDWLRRLLPPAAAGRPGPT
jgi:hypothetical protein